MIILGIAIVIVTFYAIVKNDETRVVLMLSGLLMAFIGGAQCFCPSDGEHFTCADYLCNDGI